jgi:hypothetical protein
MIPLNHGEGSSSGKDPPQFLQGKVGSAEMLEHEADEDVIHAPRPEGKTVDIAPDKPDVRYSGLFHPAGGGAYRRFGDVHGGDVRTGRRLGKDYGLGAHSTPYLQDPAAGRVPGVMMEQMFQGAGLILETDRLPGRISMHVRILHGYRTGLSPRNKRTAEEIPGGISRWT